MAESRSLGAAGLHAVLGGAIGVELSEPQGGERRPRDCADEGAVGAVSAPTAIGASASSSDAMATA